MPKGTEQNRNAKKKAKLTLKEKRLRKKEKKFQHQIRDARDVYEE
jgi:hypothetical protein